jgi:hypothetical protein
MAATVRLLLKRSEQGEPMRDIHTTTQYIDVEGARIAFGNYGEPI